MIRLVLCFLSLFLLLPAYAGPFEDAMNNHSKVILYIYTPKCSYCNKFEPNFNKLIAAYGQKCKFVKLDGTTQYGAKIAYQSKVSYVPYFVMIDNKARTGNIVSIDCLLKYSCVSQKVDKFIK